MNEGETQTELLNIKANTRFVNFLFVNQDYKSASYIKILVVYAIIMVAFLGLSIWLFVEAGSIKEKSVTYYFEKNGDNFCFRRANCISTFELDEQMEAPILVEFVVYNFYENIRRFIQSKSSYQLAGNFSV